MEKINSTLAQLISILSFCLVPLIAQSQSASQGIILYTTYTNRSVTPGQNLKYSIEVINRTNRIQNITFSVQGVPDSWNPALTAGSNAIQQIAVKPEDLGSGFSENINLDLDIPLKIEKGDYPFKVVARAGSGLEYVLPLRIKVTEQGIFETELQADQANMEGYTDSNFNYNLTLKNRTAQEQNYALRADAPQGWSVRFRVGGDYVTSVALPSNESKSINVRVTPSQKVKADTYTINVEAASGSTSGRTTLETVIKGKHDLVLTTPSGRLSTQVTAGGTNDIKLLLKNTGTVPLRDIELSSSSPVGWSVKFDDEKIPQLNAGESTTVNATISAASKAIAGDYRLKIEADTPDVSSEAAFRVTVSKSLAWSSVGIAIILFVAGGISYLFKKYGRR